MRNPKSPSDQKALQSFIEKLKREIAENQRIVDVLEEFSRGANSIDRPTLRKKAATAEIKTGKASKATESTGMPRISSETWLSAIGKRPKTAGQIFDSVIAKMFGLTDEQKEMVRGRIYPALANLNASKKIKAEGERGSMKYSLV
jgi:hypothetical protein